MTENFQFTAQIKKWLYYMMGTGAVGIAVLLLYPHNHFSRLWSNILACTYFFTGIALFGMFVVAATQLAYGGWQTLMKRIFLSMSAFVKVGGGMLVVILILGILGVHSLYEHVNNITALKKVAVSSIYTTKLVYFSTVFWVGRVILYWVLWYLFSVSMNNFFARTDQTNPKVYKRSKLLAAAFIVTFALTESAVSWDMIMSLDPKWYSTLFGWYNFASYGCAAWGMSILIVIFLKSQGYLQRVNENHVHDLGKMLFGFSVLWTYMWFDQFMLQWFANIPEETTFWVKRFDVGYFKGTIFLSLIINFGFPLLFLIKRGAKRNFRMIGFGAALLVFGHYVDFFNYTFVESNWNKKEVEKRKEEKKEGVNKSEKVFLYAEAEEKKKAASDATPAKENKEGMATEVKKAEGGGEKKEEKEGEVNYAGIGIGEILVFIGFLGGFLFMFFNNLTKHPMIPEDDPYLHESEKLTVTYA